MSDALAKRMKGYEAAESERRLIPLLPVVARMDGVNFSAFTKNMTHPFDLDFSQVMVDTAIALVKETGACMGFTQSDEITLTWHYPDHGSEFMFGGRIQKLVGHLAVRTTTIFSQLIAQRMPNFLSLEPTFDARIWNVPTIEEGAATFLWREKDATKNSVNMAASSLYDHETLLGQSRQQKLDLLYAKGVNWNNYPARVKRGTYVQRRTISTPFSVTEIELLPPRHRARFDPDLRVERTAVVPLELPPLHKIQNQAAVIYGATEPILQN